MQQALWLKEGEVLRCKSIREALRGDMLALCALWGQMPGPPPTAWAAGMCTRAKDCLLSSDHLWQSSRGGCRAKVEGGLQGCLLLGGRHVNRDPDEAREWFMCVSQGSQTSRQWNAHIPTCKVGRLLSSYRFVNAHIFIGLADSIHSDLHDPCLLVCMHWCISLSWT